MKFILFWATSIYICKLQVKVEVGGSHVQENGGRKSGVALVKYRSKSTLERPRFFPVFLADIELHLWNTSQSRSWTVQRLKSHCVLNVFVWRHRVAPVNYKSKSKLEGPMFKNSMFLIFLGGKRAVEEWKCIDLLNEINVFLENIDLHL